MECSCGLAQANRVMAVVIVILIALLLAYYYMHMESMKVAAPRGAYLGHGIGDPNMGVYTSGATLRALGQVFSSTNQGAYTTLHNMDIDDPAERERQAIPVVIMPVLN